MKGNKKAKGAEGEELACSYIAGLGYRIVERNFFYGHGEIDIIAEDNGILVFIEVKTKTNLDFGPPELAVTRAKQGQIRKIAAAYLAQNNISDKDCRLDVIAILILNGEKPRINHIINAF